MPPFGARAYGCWWQSAFPLPLFQPADAPRPGFPGAVVQVSQAAAGVPDRPFLIANGRQQFSTDGLRYVADDGTLLDVYGTNRIEIQPGAEWSGEPPAAFYGTVTAALLAGRGDLPMHGSAIEIGGRAVLLCGHSGAGKSTLTAALISAGGRLLSDDLSGVRLDEPEADFERKPIVYAGRRAIRLFPDVAGFFAERVPVETLHPPGEAKVLAIGPAAAVDQAYPLAAVVMLGDDGPLDIQKTAGLKLLEFSFRRRAFRHLPGFEDRVRIARYVAHAVPLLTLPGVQARSREQFRAIADHVLQKLAAAGV